jgi:hypothetical protein
LHGWSDDYESFIPLGQWLTANGFQVVDIHLGNYLSMKPKPYAGSLANRSGDTAHHFSFPHREELSLHPGISWHTRFGQRRRPR